MTMSPEDRLEALGIVLPRFWQLPPGVVSSAAFTRRDGDRLLLSGHVPIDMLGQVAGPAGKVGAQVSVEDACDAARRCLLALLATIRQTVGSLDEVASWTVLRGYVNSAPEFCGFPVVLNSASDLLLDVFGPTAGSHARVAIGVAGLPFNAPVELEAEVRLR